MKVKLSSRVLLAALLAIAMLGSLFAPIATAVNRQAGEDGYVSLHQYVSKTDDPDVYKLKMHIKASNSPTNFDVVFLVDASDKMMTRVDPTGVSTLTTHFEAQLDAVYDAASILLDPSRNPHLAEGANRARVFIVFYNGNVYGIDKAPAVGYDGELVDLIDNSGAGTMTVTDVAYVSNSTVDQTAGVSGGLTKFSLNDPDEDRSLEKDLAAIGQKVRAEVNLRHAVGLATPGTLVGFTYPLLADLPKIMTQNGGFRADNGAPIDNIAAFEQHYSAAALAAAYDIYAEYSSVEPGDPNYVEQAPNGGPDEYQHPKSDIPVQRKITIMLSADRDFQVRDPLKYISDDATYYSDGVTTVNTPLPAATDLQPKTIAQEGAMRAEALAIAKAMKFEVHNKNSVNTAANPGGTLYPDTGLAGTDLNVNLAFRTHSSTTRNSAAATNFDPIRTVPIVGTPTNDLTLGAQTGGTPKNPELYSGSSQFPLGAFSGTGTNQVKFNPTDAPLYRNYAYNMHSSHDNSDFFNYNTLGGMRTTIDPAWTFSTTAVGPASGTPSNGHEPTVISPAGPHTVYNYVGWSAFNFGKDAVSVGADDIEGAATVYNNFNMGNYTTTNVDGWVETYAQDTAPGVSNVTESPLKAAYQRINNGGGMGAEIWTIGYATDDAGPNNATPNQSYDDSGKRMKWEGRFLDQEVTQTPALYLSAKAYYTDFVAPTNQRSDEQRLPRDGKSGQYSQGSPTYPSLKQSESNVNNTTTTPTKPGYPRTSAWNTTTMVADNYSFATPHIYYTLDAAYAPLTGKSAHANYEAPKPHTKENWHETITWSSTVIEKPDPVNPSTNVIERAHALTPGDTSNPNGQAANGQIQGNFSSPDADGKSTRFVSATDTASDKMDNYLKVTQDGIGGGPGTATPQTLPTIHTHIRTMLHWPYTGTGNTGGDHNIFNGVVAKNGGAENSMAEYLLALAGTNEDGWQPMMAGANTWISPANPNTNGAGNENGSHVATRVGWLKTWRELVTGPQRSTTSRFFTTSTSADTVTTRFSVGDPRPVFNNVPTLIDYTWYQDWEYRPNYTTSAANAGWAIENTDYANYAEGFRVDFTARNYANAIKEFDAHRKDDNGTHMYDKPDYTPVTTFVQSVSTPTTESLKWNISNLMIAYQDMVYDLYKIGGGLAIAEIADQFELVNTTAKVTYGSPIPERVVLKGGGFTSSVSGNTVTWDLSDKGGIFAATDYFLEFYIRMLPDQDPNLYFAVEDRAYIANFQNRTLFRHKEQRGNYVRYIIDDEFPMKYIQGNGEIVEPLEPAAPGAQQPELNSLLGFFAIPYGTPTKIEEVKVEEMSVEQTLRDVMSASAYFLNAHMK